VYQSIIIPFGTEALNVTTPDPQRELLLAPVGSAVAAFTVANTAVREADRQFPIRASA
jgi:hypothetical protein